jgi:hypothetical protein
MNLETTLVGSFLSNTGSPLYALEKPIGKAVPCTVFRFIAETPILTLESYANSPLNDTKLRKARIQFTAIADSAAALRTLVNDTEQFLYGNDLDFEVTVPIGTKLQSKEDNLYYSVSEYYIWYKAD